MGRKNKGVEAFGRKKRYVRRKKEKCMQYRKGGGGEHEMRNNNAKQRHETERGKWDSVGRAEGRNNKQD